MATFLALRCYACGMFQVKQQKKSSKKWNCTICNEKQSVTKVHGSSGSARDIRGLVQQLNLSSHAQEEKDVLSKNLKPNNEQNFVAPEQMYFQEAGHRKPCKWDEYLDKQEESTSKEEDDPSYVTVIPDVLRKRPGHTKYEGYDQRRENTRTLDHPETPSSSHLLKRGEDVLPSKRKKVTNDENDTREFENSVISRSVGSKVHDGIRQEQLETEKVSNKPESKTFSSKWSKYLDADSVSHEPETKVKNVSRKWSSYLDEESNAQVLHKTSSKWWTLQQNETCTYGDEVKTEINDENVIEDIHPSFL